jgi:hypothetical protein
MLGDIVEDVRTVSERIGDASMYIPVLATASSVARQ